MNWEHLKLLFKKKDPLKKHPFFYTIEHYMEIELYNLPIENPVKKRVVVSFMKIQFKSFYDEALTMVNKLESTDLSDTQKKIFKCVADAEDDAVKNGIPYIFIEKFRKWNSKNIDIMVDYVNQITRSEFYPTKHNKMAAILDILQFSLRIMLVDAEDTINEMNGDLERALKGTVFDNI